MTSTLGPRSPWYAFGLLILLDTVFLICIEVRQELGDKGEEADAEISFASVWKQLQYGDIVLLNVILLMCNFGWGSLQGPLPLYLSRTLGAESLGVGLVLSTAAGSYMAARALSGILITVTSEGAMTCLGVCLMGGNMFAMPYGSHLWILLPASVGVGAGLAVSTTPCMTVLAMVADQNPSLGYGVVYSLADITQNLGLGLGPTVGTVLDQQFGFS